MRIANPKDLAFGVVLLLASAFLFNETFHFRKVAYFSIGPTAFPRVLLGSLLLLSSCLIFQSLDFRGKAKAERKDRAAPDKKSLFMQVGFIGLIFVYVGLMNVLGYLASSVLFMVVGMLLLGNRNIKSLALYAGISAAVALLLQFVFQNLLHLFLP